MITDEKKQRTYLYTLRAMQMFVFCASLAPGIVQCLALKEKPGGEMDQACWRRTKSERKVSVETVLRYIRENLYDMVLTDPESLVFRALAGHDSGWAGKRAKMKFKTSSKPGESTEKNEIEKSSFSPDVGVITIKY